MYCAACATPLAPGLSFCNRCGMSLKERNDSKPNSVQAYLTAITVIGVSGLGLVLGGAIALRNGAQFGEEIIGIFMLMTFFIVSMVELFLCRQLSRLMRAAEKRASLEPAPLQVAMPIDVRGPQPRALAEPGSSVTENTTRTLEYSRTDPVR